LHEKDPAARRVHLFTEHLIRGADRQTEAAMHAGLNGPCHVPAGRTESRSVDGVMHGEYQESGVRSQESGGRVTLSPYLLTPTSFLLSLELSEPSLRV